MYSFLQTIGVAPIDEMEQSISDPATPRTPSHGLPYSTSPVHSISTTSPSNTHFKTDDEIASELLSQFPPFGSHSGSAGEALNSFSFQALSPTTSPVAAGGYMHDSMTAVTTALQSLKGPVTARPAWFTSPNNNKNPTLGTEHKDNEPHVHVVPLVDSDDDEDDNENDEDEDWAMFAAMMRSGGHHSKRNCFIENGFAYQPPPFLWEDLEALERRNAIKYGTPGSNGLSDTSSSRYISQPSMLTDQVGRFTHQTFRKSLMHRNNSISNLVSANNGNSGVLAAALGDVLPPPTVMNATAHTSCATSGSILASHQHHQGCNSIKGPPRSSRAIMNEWEQHEMDLWRVDKTSASPTPHPERKYFSLSEAKKGSPERTKSPKRLNRLPPSSKKKLLEQPESEEEDPNNMTLDRDHWMPDKLCKHCYACEIPFTVFRRRHHCRLCGQVFCSNCSAYFIELLPSSNGATAEIKESFIVKPEASNATPNNNATVRACKMCYEQVSAQQAETLKAPSTSFMPLITMMKDEEELTDHVVEEKIGKQIADKKGVTFDSTTIAKSHEIKSQKISTYSNFLDVGLQPDIEDRNNARLQNLETALQTTQIVKSTKGIIVPNSEVPPLLANHMDTASTSLEQSRPKALKDSFSRLSPGSTLLRRESPENTSKENPIPADQVIKDDEPPVELLQGSTPEIFINKLGQVATQHLERMCAELLHTEAPLLLQEIRENKTNGNLRDWMNMLLMLATKCSFTVRPNIKKGDLLDIRMYSKVKVIPGGNLNESAYMSGIIFPKNVNHKSMAREIVNPKVMLLSGGIEFSRTEHRIASLQTLLEQEEKYMEILVTKIVGLKPDVLLVGRAVSRRAQELLLHANVVLIQHVKPSLMQRVARQTGATILSSTDHVMNQFGTSVLGKCRRFRLVTFRYHDWKERCDNARREAAIAANKGPGDPNTIKNHERQEKLAAQLLGNSVVDGVQAVRAGLAKRCIARTYIMMEGCPKNLGCTMMLRGASRPALKEAKNVLIFLCNVSYNIKLETTYLKERYVTLPSSYSIPPRKKVGCTLQSSSLCVDYGQPPFGRIVKPWNGAANTDSSTQIVKSSSGTITAMDHQSILITSVWMTGATQCCPAEVKGICYYTRQDVSLGQFLHDSCFNMNLKCQNTTCKKSVLEHTLSFIHADGLINITVETMEDPLPPAPIEQTAEQPSTERLTEKAKQLNSPIATWTFCNSCAKVVTPLIYISEETWNYSFGKFLEVYFYNRDAIINSPEYGCSCKAQSAATLYFGCGRLATKFTYETVRPFGVYVRRIMPLDPAFHVTDSLRHLERILSMSSSTFVRFDKHIERVSREARQLFGSAANKPEHLQTVLSELNNIGSEVDRATKILHEKIASVSTKLHTISQNKNIVEWLAYESLLRFPWHIRRYLFLLASAWNERLSAAGQALAAMKKLATESNARRTELGMVHSDGYEYDDVLEGMRRLKDLQKGQRVYSQYNTMDMSLRTDFKNEGSAKMAIISGDINPKATRARLRRSSRQITEYDYHDEEDVGQDDADFDDDLDFDDERMESSEMLGESDRIIPRRRFDSSSTQVKKTLGSRRTMDNEDLSNVDRLGSFEPPELESKVSEDPNSRNKSVTTTAGGAVKSAITRFFNRLNTQYDPYIVDLGELAWGLPRMEPGLGGVVLPVFESQPSTVVAHSLSSETYAQQFAVLLKIDGRGVKEEESTSLEDFFGDPTSRKRDTSKHGNKGSAEIKLTNDKKDIEKRMLVRSKTHVKHSFRDADSKGQTQCKFACTIYWATQFHAVRQAYLSDLTVSDGVYNAEAEKGYIHSLSESHSWATSGGKSGANFAKTADGRFIAKSISRTELQMFLDCAPAYFEYLSKAFFHGLPTVLCKILGVYQIAYHNRVTGKRTMEQIAIMPNMFYNRKISVTFDLKGSLRGRIAQKKPRVPEGSHSEPTIEKKKRKNRQATENSDSDSDDSKASTASGGSVHEDDGNVNKTDSFRSVQEKLKENPSVTLLDGDFLEFTGGRPLPLTDRAKAIFHMSILNDTLFLSIINVLDYSILVGMDEERNELVVGIIDFFRQYDILKQMERVGKSIPMVVGSEAPTIIQPPLYKARFTNAMERYFMTVPTKWTTI